MTDQPGSAGPPAGHGVPGEQSAAPQRPGPVPASAREPEAAPHDPTGAADPAGSVGDGSADTPDLAPAAAPVESSDDAVADAPVDVPVDAPVDVPVDAPVETPAETPDVPVETPVDVSAEPPGAPVGPPDCTPDTAQGQTPAEAPEAVPAPKAGTSLPDYLNANREQGVPDDAGSQETVRLAISHTAQLLPQVDPITKSEDDARDALVRVRDEVAKAVVGQEATVSGLVLALLCRGHVLLEGVPGVAKTLLVRALSAALDLDSARVQFTPDLMPGDVTGSLVYDAGTARFSFREGPVFTNLLLADEINRTPPKTQASLLEAMQERQVSVDGRPLALPDPFLVVATQNPVEYEGTYPLPEAQLDRFLLKLTVPLPAREAELKMLARHAEGFDPQNLAAAGIRPVATAKDLAAAWAAVQRVAVSEAVMGYVVDVVRATRTSPSLSLGVSPRGATALLATSRAWAWLAGRDYVTPDDVKALARPTLRHRMQLRPEAELEGTTTEGVLDTVLSTVAVPR